MLATMVDKEHFAISDWLNGHIWHIASLSIDSPKQTTTQQIFLSLQALKNLTSLRQAGHKPK